VNLLDSGAPFYDVYQTQDDQWLAVACLEPKFFAIFLSAAGLDGSWADVQYDTSRWDDLRRAIADVLRTRTQADWDVRFAGIDACVSPVLTMEQARLHPHLLSRGIFLTEGDLVVPAPAPRFQSPTIVE
jgi:alpha-methylacyl-CoA racemase